MRALCLKPSAEMPLVKGASLPCSLATASEQRKRRARRFCFDRCLRKACLYLRFRLWQPGISIWRARHLVRLASVVQRDPVSQLASGQSALQQGEYAIVAQRISALLATGELREPAMALLIELLKQPDGRAAFAEQLASPGYWQANSLLSIYRVVDKGQWAQTLALAQEKGAELECGRFKALAQAYENDGRGAEAALFMPANCRAT